MDFAKANGPFFLLVILDHTKSMISIVGSRSSAQLSPCAQGKLCYLALYCFMFPVFPMPILFFQQMLLDKLKVSCMLSSCLEFCSIVCCKGCVVCVGGHCCCEYIDNQLYGIYLCCVCTYSCHQCNVRGCVVNECYRVPKNSHLRNT